jgi:hypothetical protein
MENFTVADSLPQPRQAQRLDCDIQTEFVSILEAVHECARDAVDANRNAIDFMDFNAVITAGCVETKDLHGRCEQAQSRVSPLRHGKVDRSLHLRNAER